MPQEPLTVNGLPSAEVHAKIRLLIDNLVNIKDEGGLFLLKLRDGKIIDTKGWNDWEWTHGIGLYGLWQYHRLSGSEEVYQIIVDWFDRQLSTGTTKNINTMAPFLTLACMFEASSQSKYTYVPWLEAWAEWAMRELDRTKLGGMQHVTYLNKHENQLWDDTLMMTALPLAKIGKVLNRPEYVEEAKLQFLLHITYLFDPSSGLFFHGWQFDHSPDTDGGHNFARARWARGNCWITVAIPDLLDLLALPSNDSFRVYLTRILEAQCRSLQRLQDSSGLWRTLLDVPESEGSYPESSATAGFAYGILKAVRKGYLPKEFQDCGIKAVKAVISKMNDAGELVGTSFGTGMGLDLQHYKNIRQTSMPYGQSMAIMALVEFLRLFC